MPTLGVGMAPGHEESKFKKVKTSKCRVGRAHRERRQAMTLDGLSELGQGDTGSSVDYDHEWSGAASRSIIVTPSLKGWATRRALRIGGHGPPYKLYL